MAAGTVAPRDTDTDGDTRVAEAADGGVDVDADVGTGERAASLADALSTMVYETGADDSAAAAMVVSSSIFGWTETLERIPGPWAAATEGI
jgi:hypothetical protein